MTNKFLDNDRLFKAYLSRRLNVLIENVWIVNPAPGSVVGLILIPYTLRAAMSNDLTSASISLYI